jgi:hypothetical protein
MPHAQPPELVQPSEGHNEDDRAAPNRSGAAKGGGCRALASFTPDLSFFRPSVHLAPCYPVSSRVNHVGNDDQELLGLVFKLKFGLLADHELPGSYAPE